MANTNANAEVDNGYFNVSYSNNVKDDDDICISICDYRDYDCS
jgi:hypothetical protein